MRTHIGCRTKHQAQYPSTTTSPTLQTTQNETHLNQNPPRNSPLLQTHNPSPNLLRRNLTLIHRHDRTRNSNGNTRDHAPETQQRDAIRRRLEDRAQYPDSGGNLDGGAAGEAVGDEGGGEGANERARGHGGGDAALAVAMRAVEVANVGLGAEDAGHGGDVEAEEGAAEGGEGTNEVDVVEGLFPMLAKCMIEGSSRVFDGEGFKVRAFMMAVLPWAEPDEEVGG